jgi:hypothetical protein
MKKIFSLNSLIIFVFLFLTFLLTNAPSTIATKSDQAKGVYMSGSGGAITDPPYFKNQCMKDGWENFINFDFKNQGACVSYVESNEKAGKREQSPTPTPIPTPTPTPTPTPEAPTFNVWINEIHYDNEGVNTEEGVEISGQAGTDLSGWRLVFYDGATGAIYDYLSLTGIIPDQQNGFGTIWFPNAGIQNGFFDGIVLENPSSEAIQFISYEGVMYAIHGSVAGQNSIDIGVSEHPPAPVGYSLQLSGTGYHYADFSWTGPIGHTRGSTNTGQTFN